MKILGNLTPRVQHWSMLNCMTLRLPGQWQLRLSGTSEADMRKHREDLVKQRDRAQKTIDQLDMYLNGETTQSPAALDFP